MVFLQVTKKIKGSLQIFPYDQLDEAKKNFTTRGPFRPARTGNTWFSHGSVNGICIRRGHFMANMMMKLTMN